MEEARYRDERFPRLRDKEVEAVENSLEENTDGYEREERENGVTFDYGSLRLHLFPSKAVLETDTPLNNLAENEKTAYEQVKEEYPEDNPPEEDLDMIL